MVLYCLALLFIFSVPIEQIVLLPGLGTITRAVGLLTFAVWLVSLALNRRLRRPHLFHIIAGLFFAWSSLSVLWTKDLPSTLERVNTYMQLGILLVILWDCLTTDRASRSAMQAYIFGVYIAVSSTFANFFAGNAGKYGRFAAGNFDDNDLGIIISLGIPMAWYLITQNYPLKSSKLLKIVNILFIPTAISGILLTASRTAMLSLIPSLLYIVFSLNNLSVIQQMVVFALGICSIFLLPFVIPQDTFARLSTAGDSISSGDLNGRGEIWKEGLQHYSQEPLLGVGSGAFQATVESNHVAHNTLLSSLFEVGFVGFLLFVIVCLIAFYLSARYSHLWIVIFSVLMIGAMSLSWEHRKPTWVIMSLGVIHATAEKKDIKESDIRLNHFAKSNNSYLYSKSSFK